ncbi:hypothetical protein ACJ7RV_002218 [Vibrio parahaemolyticus]
MIVTVQALEKCFYGGLLRYEGQSFPWEVPEEYIQEAKKKKKQLEDVLPEYFELVSNAPKIQHEQKFVFDDDGISDEKNNDVGPTGIPGEKGQSDPLLAGQAAPGSAPGADDTDDLNTDQIKKVLAELDHGDDSLWTDTGELRLSVLKDKLGYRVNRAELDEIAPGFKRQIA